MQLAFLFVVLALMWVFLIVPRQREARRQRAVMATLAIGDEVMSAGGIHGRITDLDDSIAMVEVAPGVSLKISRQAILSRLSPSIEPASERPDPSSGTVAGTED